MSNVLVTGGAGYIGAHACKALAASGFKPIAYDNLVHGHEWAVRWGPLAKGDVLDPNCLDQVFARYQPSAVMHFAAYAYVGESVGEPSKYYRNNVPGTCGVENHDAEGVPAPHHLPLLAARQAIRLWQRCRWI